MPTLILLFLAIGQFAQAAPHSACVVVFEREKSPIARTIVDAFEGEDGIDLFSEALPRDLDTCMNSGVERVVLVAHALRMDNFGHVNLAYFSRLNGEARSSAIANAIGATKKKIEELKIDAEKERLRPRSIRQPEVIGPATRELSRTKEYLEVLESLADNEPVYAPPQILLDRMLDNIIKSLEKLTAGRPKKLTVFVCYPEQIQQRYPFFNRLRSLGVEVEFTPTSGLWSYVMDAPVVSVTRNKLREAIRK